MYLIDRVYNERIVLSVLERQDARDELKCFFQSESNEFTGIVADDKSSMNTPVLEAHHRVSGLKFRFTFESSVPVKTAELIKHLLNMNPQCKISPSVFIDNSPSLV